jgi:DNA excision repair protein ERCC-4
MVTMQTAILDLIHFSVKELRRINPSVYKLFISFWIKNVLIVVSFNLKIQLDLDEMTVENALSKCFKKIIKFQLEPVWHQVCLLWFDFFNLNQLALIQYVKLQLSGKTKQLLEDLGILRNLLLTLTQYDCVTFNVVVKSLKTTEKALKSAGWMLLDAAENLFITTKARVYGKSLEEDGK